MFRLFGLFSSKTPADTSSSSSSSPSSSDLSSSSATAASTTDIVTYKSNSNTTLDAPHSHTLHHSTDSSVETDQQQVDDQPLEDTDQSYAADDDNDIPYDDEDEYQREYDAHQQYEGEQQGHQSHQSDNSSSDGYDSQVSPDYFSDPVLESTDGIYTLETVEALKVSDNIIDIHLLVTLYIISLFVASPMHKQITGEAAKSPLFIELTVSGSDDISTI